MKSRLRRRKLMRENRWIIRSLLVFPALFAACATTTGAMHQPSQVVAEFDGRVIRQEEVDRMAAEELLKFEEQAYDARVEAAEKIAIDAMIGAKAQEAKLTPEEWLSQQIEKNLPEPTDDEIRSQYESLRDRIPEGMSYTDVKPKLRQMIVAEVKSTRAKAIVDGLKREKNYRLLQKPPAHLRRVVDAVGPSIGPKDAAITIVEFADFECPYCARAANVVEEVRRKYPTQVRFVFRHFPLSFHQKAPTASRAAVCADEQGKFWPFHDALFRTQRIDLVDLKSAAADVEVDMAKFEACLEASRSQLPVMRDLEAGRKLGVQGTPAFYVNGWRLSGAQPLEAFVRLIDRELGSIAQN